ncbi:MAG: hypothetical protein ACRDP5_20710, partial [Streptosporangiaceae bacterium]
SHNDAAGASPKPDIGAVTGRGAAALAAQQTGWRRFAGGVHAVLGWATQAVWPPVGPAAGLGRRPAPGPAQAEPGWSA